MSEYDQIIQDMRERLEDVRNLDKIKAENAALHEAHRMVCHDLAAALDNVHDLRAALEFYADLDQWRDVEIDDDGYPHDVVSKADLDGGKIARAALDADAPESEAGK